MTVAELIEALQREPGDKDLCYVDLRVTVQRPYAKDAVMHCNIGSLSLNHGEMVIHARGYIE